MMQYDANGDEVRDEAGLPIVHQALSQEGAFTMAMQGISHALLTFWPDVVLFVSGFFTTAGLLELCRKRNFKVVMLNTESPYLSGGRPAGAEPVLQPRHAERPGQFETLRRMGHPGYVHAARLPARRTLSAHRPAGRSY